MYYHSNKLTQPKIISEEISREVNIYLLGTDDLNNARSTEQMCTVSDDG